MLKMNKNVFYNEIFAFGLFNLIYLKKKRNKK